MNHLLPIAQQMVTERSVPVSVELVYLQSMGKRKISGSICGN
jgi:hypothetical protein